VNGRASDSRAPIAASELRCRAQQPARAGVGRRAIHKDDVVVFLCEGHQYIPPDSEIDGQPWVEFEVVLRVEGVRQVSHLVLVGEIAYSRIRLAEKETGERTAVGTEIRIG
jgi:hypothetical protein